jgi:ATP-dependent Clp endopeptidase proteolytic subunit ClpP
MSESFKEYTFKNLLSDRKILINDDIDDEIIERCVMMIFSINDEDDEKEETEVGYNRKKDPIVMYIHSDGGEAYAALSLISAMETSKTPIITVALGKCASAAFTIFLAGDKRVSQKHSTFMYHQVASGSNGSLNNMKNRTDEMERLQKILDELFISRTNIKEEDLKIKYENKDWYISPKEALELGIIEGTI